MQRGAHPSAADRRVAVRASRGVASSGREARRLKGCPARPRHPTEVSGPSAVGPLREHSGAATPARWTARQRQLRPQSTAWRRPAPDCTQGRIHAPCASPLPSSIGSLCTRSAPPHPAKSNSCSLDHSPRGINRLCSPAIRPRGRQWQDCTPRPAPTRLERNKGR